MAHQSIAHVFFVNLRMGHFVHMGNAHLFSVSDWPVVVFVVGQQLLFLNFQCMLIARLCY